MRTNYNSQRSELIAYERKVWGDDSQKICECGKVFINDFSCYCSKCESRIFKELEEFYGVGAA